MRTPIAMLLITLLSACAAPESRGVETRGLAEHFTTAFWQRGLQQMMQDRSQAAASMFLLGATAVARPFDKKIQQSFSKHHYLTDGNKRHGDRVLNTMVAVGGGLALADWAFGDGSRTLEVAVESYLLSQALVLGLKSSVHRTRPRRTHRGNAFPSGHAAAAFSLATLIARRSAEQSETFGRLGYLAYLPATFVAVGRMENDRHFPTDVLAGAFLGLTITNWVYNSHAPRTRKPSAAHWQLLPHVAGDGADLLWTCSF